MTEQEPKRWKDSDDAPEGVLELLRDAGDVPPMSADDRAAILGGLPVASAPSGAAGAPTKLPLLTKTVVLTGVGVLAVAGLGVVLALGSPNSGEAKSSAPSSISTSPTSAPLVVETALAPRSPVSGPDPVASASSANHASEPPLRRAAPPPAAVPSLMPSSVEAPEAEDALAVESALVGRARAKLESNPTDALAALEDHALRFPRGSFAPERDYLRIKALRRLGRHDEARRSAERYGATYPSSPYAGPVRAILVELGER